ncbi:MAG: hypothetical protein WC846_03035 [Candidatus Gracilibacteria bacterium]|jgi:hypothetical protein
MRRKTSQRRLKQEGDHIDLFDLALGRIAKERFISSKEKDFISLEDVAKELGVNIS